jgi:hypothetical protein
MGSQFFVLRMSQGAHTPPRLQESSLGLSFSAKSPLNSAFLTGGVLHRTHAVYCPCPPPKTTILGCSGQRAYPHAQLGLPETAHGPTLE